MFHYPDPQCFSDKSLSEINLELSSPLPPSKLDPPSTFLPFFPPAFHDDGFHDFLASHLILPALDMPPPSPSPAKQLPAAPPPAPPPRRSSGGGGRPGRKRALRKDRHSKIFTAQGARDRRMRLSLVVARKFFDLQDMLGFDKASQTVQWLLTNSNSAIEGLSGASRARERAFSEADSSECEDISTVSDYKGTPPSMAVSKLNIRKAKRMIHRVSTKTAPLPAVARESRAKARARARERTREKKRINPCGWVEVNDQPNQAPPSSIPFQTVDDQSAGSHDLKYSLELVAQVEEQYPPSREGVYEFPMRGGGGRGHGHGVGLDQILEYNHHNSISNYDVISLLQEQCEMNLVRSIEERGLSTDVQFHARPWEVFSINPIL